MLSPCISTILAKHDPPHSSLRLFKKQLLKGIFICLFIFGCAGSSAAPGLSLVRVCGLLIAVACLGVDHGLWGRGL